MTREGPSLQVLLRRLVETPPEILAEPRIGKHGEIDVAAVVWDVLRDLGISLDPAGLAAFRPIGAKADSQGNRLRLVLIACWVFNDPWFRGHPEVASAARRFLEKELEKVEGFFKADRLLQDADRREELIRHLLHKLDLRPAGETEAQAADRLQTLDSAERARVLRASAQAERRAQEIREAMARAAARDAASRYGE
jgi:hypothetical protein